MNCKDVKDKLGKVLYDSVNGILLVVRSILVKLIYSTALFAPVHYPSLCKVIQVKALPLLELLLGRAFLGTLPGIF